MAKKSDDSNLKRIDTLISIAHQLFEEKGYEQVGIREICTHAGLSPTQLYRLGFTKQDLLAEVILRLNDKQIKAIRPFLPKYKTPQTFIEEYLLNLYESDIRIKSIRAEGAAFGWKWSSKYEDKIIDQIMFLMQPVKEAFEYFKYKNVEARCMAIWSLYYVGYRNAVMHNADAKKCLASIKPSLSILTSE